jgi:hypothetical protein
MQWPSYSSSSQSRLKINNLVDGTHRAGTPDSDHAHDKCTHTYLRGLYSETGNLQKTIYSMDAK